LEDVDAAFVQRDAQKGNCHVTFSGLLNALDGVAAAEERIIFMTTNHYEKMDPALIRPGRVDVQEFIGLASDYQIYNMFLRFYPEQIEYADKFVQKVRESGRELSPAQIQGHFVIYKLSHLDAYNNIDELLKPNVENILAKQH
jgi:chaperone BCS1